MQSKYDINDVKNYLLDKMPDNLRKDFERALETDDELLDMVRTLENEAGSV